MSITDVGIVMKQSAVISPCGLLRYKNRPRGICTHPCCSEQCIGVINQIQFTFPCRFAHTETATGRGRSESLCVCVCCFKDPNIHAIGRTNHNFIKCICNCQIATGNKLRRQALADILPAEVAGVVGWKQMCLREFEWKIKHCALRTYNIDTPNGRYCHIHPHIEFHKNHPPNMHCTQLRHDYLNWDARMHTVVRRQVHLSPNVWNRCCVHRWANCKEKDS